jgi:hypothetical protein
LDLACRQRGGPPRRRRRLAMYPTLLRPDPVAARREACGCAWGRLSALRCSGQRRKPARTAPAAGGAGWSGCAQGCRSRVVAGRWSRRPRLARPAAVAGLAVADLTVAGRSWLAGD